jgi:WD40 repeat protein
MLVSVSEDATCKLWKQMAGVSDGSAETLKGHMGRTIRSLACHEGLIATGGEDGAIKVWNAAEIITKKTKNEELQES